MSYNIGNNIKIQVFGQSHSKNLGIIIDGLPAGKEIDINKIQDVLNARRGGQNSYTTKRAEKDIPEIISGIVNSRTCGAPICAIFKNEDVDSKEYYKFKETPRPSHADFVANIKYNGYNDIRGGGTFSGRMTLPLCFAGAICEQLLNTKKIYIGAHIYSVADIMDTPYSPTKVSNKDLEYNAFPTNSMKAKEKMIAKIQRVKNDNDSIGGVIECAITGLPVGLGEPMFDGIENKISQLIFAIPAVKGIEFGLGFKSATMLGSEYNDEFIIEKDKVKTKTNNSGGILGGISNSMPIVFRVAIKPTPSIGKEQNTVNINSFKETKIKIDGRHDPCIVPRAVPCVKALTAIAIYDLWRSLDK